MKTYTFSVYVPVNRQRLVRRPFWNLFGSDKVVSDKQWERRVFPGINEEQAKALMQTDWCFRIDPWPSLFYRALGGELHCPQLEEIPVVSPYIAVRGNNASSK